MYLKSSVDDTVSLCMQLAVLTFREKVTLLLERMHEAFPGVTTTDF